MKFLIGFIVFMLPIISIYASNENFDLAKRIVELQNPRSNIEQHLSSTTDQIGKSIEKQNLPKEEQNESKEFLDSEIKEVVENFPFDEIHLALANFYSNEFSMNELNEILKFYNSSVGKKWILAQPKAKEKVLEIMFSKMVPGDNGNQ